MQNDNSDAGQHASAAKHSPKLAWYAYLWALMPLSLMIEGGKFGVAGYLLAGLVSVAMSYLNVRMMKEPRSALIRYFMVLVSTIAAFVIFAILITLFQAKTGQL